MSQPKPKPKPAKPAAPTASSSAPVATSEGGIDCSKSGDFADGFTKDHCVKFNTLRTALSEHRKSPTDTNKRAVDDAVADIVQKEWDMNSTAEVVVRNTKWNFVDDVVRLSAVADAKQWTKFYEPLLVRIVDQLFPARKLDSDETNRAVRFVSALSAKSTTVLLNRIDLGRKSRICSFAKDHPNTGGSLFDVCQSEGGRAVDNLYENSWFDNYDIFIAMFKLLYVWTDVSNLFTEADESIPSSKAMFISREFQKTPKGNLIMAGPWDAPSAMDPRSVLHVDTMETAIYQLHTKLWSSDTKREDVNQCLERIVTYVRTEIWELGVLKPRSLDDNRDNQITRDENSPGCLLYLLCSTRMVRTLVHLYRLTNTKVIIGSFFGGLSRWMGWWRGDGGAPNDSSVRMLGLDNEWLREIIAGDTGKDGNVQNVSIENQTVVLETILLRLYCRSRVATTAGEPFASDIRIIASRANETSIRRRLYRWYRTNINRHDDVLPACPGPEHFESIDNTQAIVTRTVAGTGINATTLEATKVAEYDQRYQDRVFVANSNNAAWRLELYAGMLRSKEIADGDGALYMAAKGIPPPLPHLDPDRPRREALLVAIWGVTDGMRSVLLSTDPSADKRDGMLASFVASVGSVWYYGSSAPVQKQPTGTDSVDTLESARKTLEETLTGHFYSGETDNHAFVERFVPWLISASMLSFIQLLTLHNPECWLSNATSPTRINLPSVVQQRRLEILRWIGARAEPPSTLDFFRRVLDIGRYVLLGPLLKQTVPVVIASSALRRRFEDAKLNHTHWEWKMFGLMRDNVDDLLAYHRTPARFRELISKAPDDGDIGALIRVNVERDIVQTPDYAAGREIFDKITTTTRNTQAMRILRDWLKRERYTDASYIAESLNNKRPRLASIETREFLD